MPVLYRILELPAGLQLVLLVAHGLAVFAVSLAFLALLRRRYANDPLALPVAPSFVAVSTTFALFLAFHGAAIWSHQHEAERSFVLAKTAAERFRDLVGPGQLDRPELRAALQRYVQAIVRDEWSRHNREPSAAADAALREIQGALVRLDGTVPAASQAQLFRLLEDIVRARAERLWIGAHFVDPDSWLVVLALGFLTHLALASVHIDKPGAARITLGLFAVASTVAYWLLAVVNNPYGSRAVIDPTQLLRLF